MRKDISEYTCDECGKTWTVTGPEREFDDSDPKRRWWTLTRGDLVRHLCSNECLAKVGARAGTLAME